MDIIKFAKDNYGDFVKRANPAMNKMTALQTLLSGKELSKEEVPLIKEFKTVQEFINLPMGDKKEVVLKKAFATAVTIAKDKGVLPFEVNSSEQIASLVDDGLTRMKVAYQTATGKIDAYQAVDALVDRVAMRVVGIADRVIEKGVPFVVDKLCMAMSKHPYTAALVPFVKTTEKYITPVAKAAVRAGVAAVVKVAKPLLKKAVDTVKAVGKKILSWLNA